MISLVRTDLPEEGGGKGAGSGGKTGAGGGPAPVGPGGGGPALAARRGRSERRDLVQYHPFDVTVICKQQALVEVLKTITGTKAPQFYVLRQIRIKNEKEKGPPRVTPDVAKPDEKPTVQYIVGEEWLDVAARWEVVDFAAPAEKAAPDQSGSTPKPGPDSKSTPAPAATSVRAISAPPTTLTPAATPAPAATPGTAATPAPNSTPLLK